MRVSMPPFLSASEASPASIGGVCPATRAPVRGARTQRQCVRAISANGLKGSGNSNSSTRRTADLSHVAADPHLARRIVQF